MTRRAGVVLMAGTLTIGAAGIATATVVSSKHRDNTQAAREAIKGGKARNVILLIGDGMGDSEITIARNYAKGAAGRLSMDSLPLTGAYTTYSVQKDNPSLPDYVTDSAASGTGWATGHKSYNGAISVLPSGKDVPTVLELARKAGYATGDVTTAELQDATPAVLGAHVVNRDCKGPAATLKLCPQNAKQYGGKGSIAEQLVQTRPDVLLGGGKKYFDETIAAGTFTGKTVLQQAQSAGYQVVTDANGLANVSWTKPILGTFAAGNMDLEYVGPTPTSTGTVPSTCQVNAARANTQPHLSAMAHTAISVLDRKSGGKSKGFFLQIEGASIDKQDHAANPCGQIGETVEFDKAVATALRYQKSHPDTLVVVTADHGHTSQIVEAGSVTPGLTATLVTKDGADMTISYGTAPAGSSQEHTGTQVRIAAGGPQAANVLGVTDQTELFYTMTRALGINT
ncbi:alkaline phosphatase [Nakamurella panacisegetis]|nr:alkaline phosphatase [Nakamurella panacisegetis]